MTPIDPREIEAKFEILNDKTAERFAAGKSLVPGYTLLRAQTTEHLDVYYDTAAFDLIRRGLALRTRKSGGGTLVTAKTLEVRRGTALVDRIEREENVSPAAGKPPYLDQCSDALQALAATRNPDGRRLRPTVTLRQLRLKRLVQQPRGKRKRGKESPPLAELSVDEVNVYRGGAKNMSASPAVCFRELELEMLPDGDADTLNRFSTRLDTRTGLQASLCEQTGGRAGSALRHGARCRRRQPQYSAGHAHGGSLPLDLAAAADAGDPARIRRARGRRSGICTRDARRHSPRGTAETLFGHYFRRSAIKPYFAGLRRLGKRLGAVRDLDVALENLRDFRATLPQAEQDNALQLEDFVQERHAAARQELLAWLDGAEHAETLIGFSKFTRKSGKGVKASIAEKTPPEPLQVRHVMPGIIMDRFARVRAYEPLFERNAAVPSEQMHALRIECKYLRYSLEFSSHLLGKEGESLILQLKAMQDHLGDFNDAQVEQARLRGWQEDGLDERLISARLHDLADTAARLQADFPAAYQTFIARKNRRLLGEALANI